MLQLRCCFIAAALMAITLLGCGKATGPAGSLSGQVFCNEELVGDCMIAFYNKSSMLTRGGKVDLDGKFEITDIPVGTYQISILQRTTNSAENEPFDERIPQKYRSFKTSELEVTINQGDNSTEVKMLK